MRTSRIIDGRMFPKSHSEPLQLPCTLHKQYTHKNKERRRMRRKRRKEKPTECEQHRCITEAAWEIPKGSSWASVSRRVTHCRHTHFHTHIPPLLRAHILSYVHRWKEATIAHLSQSNSSRIDDTFTMTQWRSRMTRFSINVIHILWGAMSFDSYEPLSW